MRLVVRNPPVALKKEIGDDSWLVGRLQNQVFGVVMWEVKSVYWDGCGVVCKNYQNEKRTGRSFDFVMAALVYINVVFMALYYWAPPSTVAHSSTSPVYYNDIWSSADRPSVMSLLEEANLVFMWIFAAEVAVRIFAIGFVQYLGDLWLLFDFVVAFLSLFAYFSAGLTALFPPTLLRVLRALRIFPFGKTLRNHPSTMRLLETLAYSIPAFFNVFLVMLLIMFIFALVGMSFFGEDIPLGEGPYGLYNSHANFRTLKCSMLTLFRMMTGESWNGIMHDVMAVKGFGWAWIYFVLFQIVGTYLLANLLIAIILDQFADVSRADSFVVTPRHIADFSDIWAHYDQRGTHFINYEDLPLLLQKVSPPLGFKGRGMGIKDVHAYVKSRLRHIPVEDRRGKMATQTRTVTGQKTLQSSMEDIDPSEGGNVVHYVETLMGLFKNAIGESEVDNIKEDAMKMVAKEIGDHYDSLTHMAYDERDVVKIIKLQAVMRQFLRRIEVEKERHGLKGYRERLEDRHRLMREGLFEKTTQSLTNLAQVAGTGGPWYPQPVSGVKVVEPPPVSPCVVQLNEIFGPAFNRYDLDQSGTINERGELEQLTVNLSYKLVLKMDHEKLQALYARADFTQAWGEDFVKAWFAREVLVGLCGIEVAAGDLGLPPGALRPPG